MSSYIGNSPQFGVFRKLDALTFNGSTTTFALLSGGANVLAGDPSQLFISLNGVIQEPGVAFTLTSGGTQIVFSTAPTNGMSFFGVLLGNTGAPTVDDGQITASKIANVAITTVKIADDSVTPDKLDRTYSTPSDVTTAIANKVNRTSSTGSAQVPVGTEAQRDGTPSAGYFRFNSDTDQFEGYNGTAWGAVGGGATGGANNPVFYENDQTVSVSYSITSGKNAMSAGPITIADGVDVTIPDGATWTIV